MTAQEWLKQMEESSDYNPLMTPLIVKYGELLLLEHGISPEKEPEAISTPKWACEYYHSDECSCFKKCSLDK